MKFIKACPACGKMLRFPIDRGIIKVSCQCGHTLIVNPDDTELYKDGKFDLRNNGTDKRDEGFVSFFKSLSNRIRKKVNYRNLINSLLDLKYKLQNLSLMPDAERNRIILTFLSIIALLIFLLYLIIR